MKKGLFVIVIFISSLFLTGCFNKKSDIKKDFLNKVEKSKGYHLMGELEIINNEDSYLYDVDASYKSNDYYRVSLKNKTNNHEQIILKNETGVYVLTPSLNKSFKFQSDWPYNSSQSYLLQTLVSDIKNDDTSKVECKNDECIIETKVIYANNKNLIKQKIYFKNGELTKVEVIDKDSNTKIKMIFNNIDYKASFDNNYFNLDSNMNLSKTEQTINEIDSIIYPMYLPSNTYLTSKDIVPVENGERVILTFSGDNPFMIIEETVGITDDFVTLPVYGEIEWTLDTLGVITDNTVNWISNGIEYYAVSDTLNSEELLQVVNSFTVLPVGK